MLVDEATRILSAPTIMSDFGLEAEFASVEDATESSRRKQEFQDRLRDIDQDLNLVKAAMYELGRSCPLVGEYFSLCTCFGDRLLCSAAQADMLDIHH